MRWLSIILVTIIAIAVVVYMSWGKLPSMLSDHLTQMMGVEVTVKRIGLGFERVSVYGFSVDNVKGGILKKALSVKEIGVRAPLTHYMKDEIIIEEIAIDGIYLGLEFNNAKGVDGNWTELMKTLETKTASAVPTSEKTRSLLVKKVILTNISTDLVYRDSGKVQHLPHIDRMELNNISSSGGLPVDQLMNSVLGQMLKQVFIRQNVKDMLQDLLQGNSPLNQFIPAPVKRFIPFGAALPTEE